jgi:IclR family transcriptional regulator, pca regulon regulatory protein
MRENTGRDFIEALARGLDVIRVFGDHPGAAISLAQVAGDSGLARPTARRILLTLENLGYVRADGGRFTLTPRVLDLGLSYIASSDIWTITRPHLADLVRATGESCSIAQLDGSDIVYVSRVAVAKLVTLSVTIGTRFPALQTSLGKVLLAALPDDELREVLAIPSRSSVRPTWTPNRSEIMIEIEKTRRQGWAATDQQLAPAIRSVAAPIKNTDGVVIAAANVNAHAMETSMETLIGDQLPRLLETTAKIEQDIARWERLPLMTISSH